MIDLLKRHAIQVLRQAGHTLAEIAELVAVGKRSVQRVAGEPVITQLTYAAPPTGVDDAPVRGPVGRPAKAEAYRAKVTAWLTDEPELLSVELLRRAKLAGYAGAKSALYELVRTVRPTTPRPVMRFEGLPGEFTQHDFGQVLVRFLDGTTRRVHFFASRLKYSRWVEVSLVPNEQVETLARTLVDHFAAMGGIPLLAVFDRPKTVALHWRKNGEVTEWNPTFAGVVLDLGLGVEVCWPHAPQQKGSIENLVGWVKGSFFKQRRFVDAEDLRTQLGEWLVEVNTQRPSRATGIIPARRRAEELPRLRPLKVTPDELALRLPIVVGPTGYVLDDTHRVLDAARRDRLQRDPLSLPHRLRIVAGRFDATHPRLCGPDAGVDPDRAPGGDGGRRLGETRQALLEAAAAARAGRARARLSHRAHAPASAPLGARRRCAACAAPGARRDRAPRRLRPGLAAHVFGAEYIAHYLARSLTPSLDAAHSSGGLPQELVL